MAQIPLRVTNWVYDEDQNLVIMQFEDVSPPSDPDPVNFKPSQTFTVHFTPDHVENQILEASSVSASPSAP